MEDKNKDEDDPLPEPDDFILPKGLRRFNRPGFFATLIGTYVKKERREEEEENLFDPSTRFVDALLASLVATLVVFPLDVIKSRQQMTRPWEPLCTGIFQCFRQIQRKEGIRGLFRGATIVLVMTTPEKALKQVSNEYFRLWIADHGDNAHKKRAISLKEEVFAGLATGLLPMIVNSPADMIKGHLQDAGRLEKPKMSSWQILRHTMKTCGLHGLYAGGVTTITREVLFSAGYFPLMEHIRRSGIFGAYTKDQSVLSSTFVAGLVAASVMAWVTTPLEVVGTRIQMSAIILLQAAPGKLAPEVSKIKKALEKGKLAESERLLWAVENPFREAIINQSPTSETNYTKLVKPPPEKQQALKQALQGERLPFHLAPEKPIRRYTRIGTGRTSYLLAKSEENKQTKSSRTPLNPSSIYYDVSKRSPPPVSSFSSVPSVGTPRSEVYTFRSRPSVGAFYKKIFKILESSGSGWGNSDYIQYRRSLPPPSRQMFYSARVLYRIISSQGIKATFRGAACRVAAIAPRMAITQMLYSSQITDRLF